MGTAAALQMLDEIISTGGSLMFVEKNTSSEVLNLHGVTSAGGGARSSDGRSGAPLPIFTVPPGAVDSSRVGDQNNTGGLLVGTCDHRSMNDFNSDGGFSHKCSSRESVHALEFCTVVGDAGMRGNTKGAGNAEVRTAPGARPTRLMGGNPHHSTEGRAKSDIPGRTDEVRTAPGASLPRCKKFLRCISFSAALCNMFTYICIV